MAGSKKTKTEKTYRAISSAVRRLSAPRCLTAQSANVAPWTGSSRTCWTSSRPALMPCVREAASSKASACSLLSGSISSVFTTIRVCHCSVSFLRLILLFPLSPSLFFSSFFCLFCFRGSYTHTRTHTHQAGCFRCCLVAQRECRFIHGLIGLLQNRPTSAQLIRFVLNTWSPGAQG